ncbi:hypothetical protein CDV31_001167 [Fusarium ambrosium]|uniref:Uncharacterized protein n=1 Tax=Fusarium ambrosium TaxID=131363 RepID=A0A428V0L2_9HYPO|nr:hypothetical protein CDV31_001167 [Fusarium ambrosium]
MQVATSGEIDYLLGMTRGKAEAQSAHIYDQAEIMRLDTHNKTILLALARQRIVRFSENGVGKNTPPPPSVHHDDLTDDRLIPRNTTGAILNKIPKKSQQILGRREVKPIDLLDLPRVPKKFPHRLTYVDIAADVGPSNVRMMPTLLHPSRPVKAVNPGVQIQPTMDTRLYIGSSLAGRGGYTRLQVHEKESTRGTPGTGGMYYGFTRQAGVVPNYQVVGVWTNPNRLRSDH